MVRQACWVIGLCLLAGSASAQCDVNDPDQWCWDPWHPASDWDGDGIPNSADPDWDGDGTPNCSDTTWPSDPCDDPYIIAPPLWCFDPGITLGVGCWPDDDDLDGIPNKNDPDSSCYVPWDPFSDLDGDGLLNVADPDDDGDGIPDACDDSGPHYDPDGPCGDLDGDGEANEDDCDDDGDGVCDDCDQAPFDCTDDTLVAGCVDGGSTDPGCGEQCADWEDPPGPGDGDPGGDYPGDDPGVPPYDDPAPPEDGDPTPPDDPIPDPPENDPPTDDECCQAICERLDDIITMLKRLDDRLASINRDVEEIDDYLRYLGGRLVTDADSWRNVSTGYLHHMDQLLVFITGQLEEIKDAAGGGPGSFSEADITMTTPENDGSALESMRGDLAEEFGFEAWPVPSSQTTPPDWNLYFDPGDYFPAWMGGAFDVQVDWSAFALIRTALHAVLLATVSMGAAGMVWEELRRYG